MILDDVKADAAKMAEFEREWETATVAKAWREITASPEYAAAFKRYYEQRRRETPARIPYEYQTYVHLREAHARGMQAFRQAFQAYLATKKSSTPPICKKTSSTPCAPSLPAGGGLPVRRRSRCAPICVRMRRGLSKRPQDGSKQP